MSSTYSSNKCAGVFQTDTGKPFYVLFEETAESNVYPRVARWSCISMGYIEDVLAVVFSSAACCVGESLRGAGGRPILPESYISAWLKALANPTHFPDAPIILDASRGNYGSIPDEKADQVLDIITKAGFQGMAEQLKAGQTVELSLHTDHALLAGIYNGQVLGAWRVISTGYLPTRYSPAPELGYNPPATISSAQTLPEFKRLNNQDETLLIQDANGRWRNGGWGYSVVADYVRELWKSELGEPGTYRSRIKAYRTAVKDAPCLPSSGVKVVVDTAQEVERWEKSRVEKLVNDVPHTRTGDLAIFDLPTDARDIYDYTSLPSEAVYFQWENGSTAASGWDCGSMVQMAMPGFN